MKLLEKLKNTFFEEEYIEVEEPEKKEVVARKVEPKVVKKEEKVVPKVEKKKEVVVEEIGEQVEDKKIENYADSELVNKNNKVSYFEDDDFISNEFVEPKKQETKKIYGGTVDKVYDSSEFISSTGNKPYSAPLKEAFKPTPIISPIYGVLDKNYKKEEVIDRKDKPSSYVSRRNADLDSIRKKAYGNFESYEDKVESKNEEKETEDNLLYDMTQDKSMPVVDHVTIADAEEYFEDLGLEYNIDYKDNRYEKATGRRTSINMVDANKEEEVKEEANLEDNLFDLIDNMYEEDYE